MTNRIEREGLDTVIIHSLILHTEISPNLHHLETAAVTVSVSSQKVPAISSYYLSGKFSGNASTQIRNEIPVKTFQPACYSIPMQTDSYSE
jgi:hypothetical protein